MSNDNTNPFAKGNPFVVGDEEEGFLPTPPRGEALLREGQRSTDSSPDGPIPKLTPPPKNAPVVGQWAGGLASVNPFGSSSQQQQASSSSNTAGNVANNVNALLTGREREMSRREEAVKKRERELAELEFSRMRSASRIESTRNWPRCKPILHHDIEGDCLPGNWRMVRVAYVAWVMAASAYVLNWLTITIAFATRQGPTIGDWFFATMVSAIGLPSSWTYWYRGVYFAAQTDSRLVAYAAFFLHVTMHILFAIWRASGAQQLLWDRGRLLMAIGAPGVGEFSAGFFRMAWWLRGQEGSGLRSFLAALALINAGLWSMSAILALWALRQAYLVFRGSGGYQEMRRQREQQRLSAAVAAATTIS